MIGPVASTPRTDWTDAGRPGRAASDRQGTQAVLAPFASWPRGPVRGAAQAASPYLAQLIAVRDGLPQARERRRADPAEGCGAYRGAAERVVAPVPAKVLAVA